MHDDPLNLPPDAAEYLRIKVPTLEKWRLKGSGPAYIKVGRLIRYRQSALDDWLEQQTVVAGGQAA